SHQFLEERERERNLLCFYYVHRCVFVSNNFLTDTFTNNQSNSKMQSHSQDPATSESRSRFEAYNRLQAAAVAFGEKLPIPEIVAIGGQSDGKSSLLEALLGFRFNVREVEMGTRRPLILQMVHDVSALEPRCRFQDEDSEEYGSPIVSATAVADNGGALRNEDCSFAKAIVMRAEYALLPISPSSILLALFLRLITNSVLCVQAKKGEPETTPDEFYRWSSHWLLLHIASSCSFSRVVWSGALLCGLMLFREIDSSFRRTIVVVSKFDNRLKEFNDRGEVDRYLSASGYLGENTRPYFVALPKDRSTISQVDMDVIRHLREGVKGGFDEEKFRSHIGFGSLRDFLESELQKRYKDAAPATLALLEQRCSEVTDDMLRMDMKMIQATSDVAHLRKAAMLYMASISNHVGALIDGAANPAPEQWGKQPKKNVARVVLEAGPACVWILSRLMLFLDSRRSRF
ncbi:hypothetical protein HID58_018241, partial [Brassica napus]